ncbi:glycoside hydrolase family 19 protein [Kribbella sp. NPDC050470]|uniref:glycoside hydrolase family 19 protein n=1 Tax=unclassified Kribbella TaxID=2644121 RepID=UPI0037A760EF
MEAGWPSLLAEMQAADITTPPRVAAFLTTIAHESRFLYNIKAAGDTREYAGRGFIQLTGSVNYTAAGAYLGAELVLDPDLALSLQWSAKIARWYWTVARNCNAMADSYHMGKINRAIGYPIGDGSEDIRRCQSFKNALIYLTGSLPEGVTCTR